MKLEANLVTITMLVLIVVFGFANVVKVASFPEQRGPKIDKLRFQVVKSPDAEVKAMKLGQIDVLTDLIRPSDVEELAAAGIQILYTPRGGFHIGHIGFNIRSDQSYRSDPEHGVAVAEVLSDVNFRHALIHCYNQSGICASIYKYIVTPVQSLVPPAQGGWHSPNVLEHPYNPGDPNAATHYPEDHSACGILRAAGYTYNETAGNWKTLAGNYLPDIHLYTLIFEVAPTEWAHGRAFVEDCNAVGIPLIHSPTDWYPEPVLRELVFGGADFDMYMMSWDLDRFPDHLYDMCHSSQDCAWNPWGYNAPGINDPELDEQVETLKFILDHEEKLAACHKAQEILYDPENYPLSACSYIQLYSRDYYNAFNLGLSGIVHSPGFGSDNTWTFLNMRWEPGHPNERIENGDSTIIWCLHDEPELLNPCYAHTKHAWEILDHICDPLIAINPYTHENLTWLATDWEVVKTPGGPGAMNVTFWLDPTVEWQDGNPFTSEDASFNWLFLRDNQIPRYASIWENIQDVEVITPGAGGAVRVILSDTSQWLLYDLASTAALLPPPVWIPLDGQPLDTILSYDPSTDSTPKLGVGPRFGTEDCPNCLYGTGPFVFQFYDPLYMYAEMLANRYYFKTTAEIQAQKEEMFHRIGDANRDGIIECSDLLMQHYSFGYFGFEPKYELEADINQDSIVDMEDIASTLHFWHTWREYPDPSVASIHSISDGNGNWLQGIGSEGDGWYANSYGKGWSFDRASEWGDFAYIDDDSAELVVGLKDLWLEDHIELNRIVTQSGGKIVNTVSMGDRVCAVVVDIPFPLVSFFVDEVKAAGLAKYIEPNLKFQIDFDPNDPGWNLQWGPRKIEADYAWNTTIGDPSVLVAVIDTGIDWNHPDLAANYNASGYDWVNNDPDPMDDHGHGTHCAGIIAAVLDNSIGIAGLAQVGIMAEKAIDSGGGGYEDDLANAIIHAVDQGADILSNSWGVYMDSMLIYDAVRYAYNADVLVVAAAGNDAVATKPCPAGYNEVVAVTATDEYDNAAWFTNFGEWVELAAPGVDIYSTTWDDSYDYMSGTSMAAPHVSGVAALAWSQHPTMTSDHIRIWLQETSDDLGCPGFDEFYGYGRINARRAVEPLPDHDLILRLEAPIGLSLGDSVLLNATVYNLGLNNETDVELFLLIDGIPVDSASISELLTETSYTINYLWTPTVEAKYNVTAYAPTAAGEDLTVNNVATKMVRVYVGPLFYVYPETIDDVTLVPGSVFTVHVMLGVSDLYAWQVNMSWDPSILNNTGGLALGLPLCLPFGLPPPFRLDQDQGWVLLGGFGGRTDDVLCSFEFLVIGYGDTVLDINHTRTFYLWTDAYYPPPLKTGYPEKENGYFSNKIPGDIDEDGAVDASDLRDLSNAYGSMLGDPNWNLECDIRKDDLIDIHDLTICAKNYGKTI